jgi:hypothetical protein
LLICSSCAPATQARRRVAPSAQPPQPAIATTAHPSKAESHSSSNARACNSTKHLDDQVPANFSADRVLDFAPDTNPPVLAWGPCGQRWHCLTGAAVTLLRSLRRAALDALAVIAHDMQ